VCNIGGTSPDSSDERITRGDALPIDLKELTAPNGSCLVISPVRGEITRSGVSTLTLDQYRDFQSDHGKKIAKGIAFTTKPNHESYLTSGRLPVVCGLAIDCYLEIQINLDSNAKSFTLVSKGEGPICRLCVDGDPHYPCGRSHKHRLSTPECPKQNLPNDVEDLPHLAGKGIHELFESFCKMTRICHAGSFAPPLDIV